MLTKQEQKILEKINTAISSGHLPSFPVTQTKKVTVDYFTNVYIKDESSQETGTHKDRMAWELIMVCRDIIENKNKGLDNRPLPRFSLISAGSAALAIQTQFRKYNLPALKILVDQKTDQGILNHLCSLGCEIYKTDLSEQMLSNKEILKLTDNTDGFDITSNQALEPGSSFYDWMAYEILNENADYVLVPYGTGHLYENILNIAKTILTNEQCNTVFHGDKDGIRKCNFIGVTTNFSNSLAVKLYAPFRPFTTSSNEWIGLFSRRGFCGKESKVLEISEEFIIKGSEIMKNLKISSEYSGAVGMGMLYQIKNHIPRDSKILVVNTGCAKFPNL